MLPVAGSLEAEFLRFQATGRRHLGVLYGCNTQPNALEDERVRRPKHVELIGIINTPLSLHLVGVYIIYINDARSDKYQTQQLVFGMNVKLRTRLVIHLDKIEYFSLIL